MGALYWRLNLPTGHTFVWQRPTDRTTNASALHFNLRGDVFALMPRDLSRFGQGGQGIRDTHLPGLIALETHSFEDFAALQPLGVPTDHFEQGFPLTATARYLSAS